MARRFFVKDSLSGLFVPPPFVPGPMAANEEKTKEERTNMNTDEGTRNTDKEKTENTRSRSPFSERQRRARLDTELDRLIKDAQEQQKAVQDREDYEKVQRMSDHGGMPVDPEFLAEHRKELHGKIKYLTEQLEKHKNQIIELAG